MIDRLSPPERAKLYSAYHAMSLIEDGMKLGLGTGSTAAWLVRLLGARNKIESMVIRATATSSVTTELAQRVGLEISDLDDLGRLDLTIDGADEFDPLLSLIKGGGGALLQEKIVATASDRMVVITDPSKRVEKLGAFPLPVEIVQFGRETTRAMIEQRLADSVGPKDTAWRMNGDARFVTDEGHALLDIHMGQIENVDALSESFLSLPGVVETGLFIDIADTVVIGAPSGEAQFVYADEDDEMADIDDMDRLDALMTALADLEDNA